MNSEQVLAAIAEVSFDDIDLNKDGVITPEVQKQAMHTWKLKGTIHFPTNIIESYRISRLSWHG